MLSTPRPLALCAFAAWGWAESPAFAGVNRIHATLRRDPFLRKGKMPVDCRMPKVQGAGWRERHKA